MSERIRVEIKNFGPELLVAGDSVLAAGGAVLREIGNRQSERCGLEFKAAVDLVADEKGTEVIRSAFPNYAILTEEQGVPRVLVKRTWVCDFLDGTTNNLNGSDMWTSLTSLVSGGELVVGASYLPALDKLLFAAKGEGAFLDNKLIHVSKVDDLSRALIVLDPGYDPKGVEKVSVLFKELRPKVGAIGMFNANGYTLSKLAMGELAGFVHFSSKVWESAGLLLAKEAGAKITDLEGNDLRVDFTSPNGFPFVVSNGLIHDQLLRAISEFLSKPH